MIPKVVIDTNVVVSSELVDEGLPAAILDLAYHGKIQMFISPEIWAEYEEVLHRPKFGFTAKRVEETLADIRACSIMVQPKRKAHKAKDKKDNRFLAAAAAADAEFIVTGNTRHFPTRYRKAHIVTPAEFVTITGSILGLPKSQ